MIVKTSKAIISGGSRSINICSKLQGMNKNRKLKRSKKRGAKLDTQFHKQKFISIPYPI